MAPNHRTLDTNPFDFIPRAEELRATGQLAQAHDLCHQALAANPHTAAGRNLHARILFDMGKYELAEEECHAVLEIAPESIPARKLLIQISIKHRLFVRAITLLENLRAEMGDDPDLLAAFIEAQRGLTERFYSDLALDVNERTRSQVSASQTELLEMLQRRPEVREAVIAVGSQEGSPAEEMLWTWSALCSGVKMSPVKFSLIESPSETVIVRSLGKDNGAVVVRIKAGVPVGPCKRLADRLAQACAREDGPEDSPDAVPVGAGHDQGQNPS